MKKKKLYFFHFFLSSLFNKNRLEKNCTFCDQPKQNRKKKRKKEIHTYITHFLTLTFFPSVKVGYIIYSSKKENRILNESFFLNQLLFSFEIYQRSTGDFQTTTTPPLLSTELCPVIMTSMTNIKFC